MNVPKRAGEGKRGVGREGLYSNLSGIWESESVRRERMEGWRVRVVTVEWGVVMEMGL